MFDQKLSRLRSIAAQSEREYAQAKLLAAKLGRTEPVRHKCFISYHSADIDEVTGFVEEFRGVFIPKVIGVSDSDHIQDPVDSSDEEYIKQRIGSKYLSDSTVTILFLGKCTWARKYVDWELSSTLRDGSVNKRNGLMALTPSNRTLHSLPDRFSDNFSSSAPSYAKYYYYPRADSELRRWVEDAFQARTSRAHLVANSRKLRTRNSQC